MEWSGWTAFDVNEVQAAPDDPAVYEVRVVTEPWVYEEGESQTVYLGAGCTSANSVRRLLLDHLEGRGNRLLMSLIKSHRLEYRFALVSNPTMVLFDLAIEFKKVYGGVPFCNRI